jgi:DNA-binding NtrC family response regulator
MTIELSKFKILLVDDEEEVLNTSRFALKTSSIKDVLICSDSRKVMSILSENKIDIMVIDIVMPYMSGKELLATVKESYPDILIIMMTGLNDSNNIVECMRMGAIDYLDKPVENLRLVTSIKRAMEFKEIQNENSSLRFKMLDTDLKQPKVFGKIITNNENMIKIFKYLEAISSSSRAVLISGDTGTGKELIAEAVHNLSGRSGKYVTINVAGLDDGLFSDALFGHKKGAYTGASHNREGMLEQAQGGSIFLDEIGDLSIASQIKLLRLLQEKEYYQLGDDTKRVTDARFIVATSQNLSDKVNDGSFRKDLYYRLHAHHVHIPALMYRKDDIGLLTNYFVQKAAQEINIEPPMVPDILLKTLKQYSFPGNIRELEAMLFNGISQTINGSDLVSAVMDDIKFLSNDTNLPLDDTDNVQEFIERMEALPTIEELSNVLIRASLKRNHNNQTYTAKSLAISRQGLLNKMKKMDIPNEDSI